MVSAWLPKPQHLYCFSFCLHMSISNVRLLFPIFNFHTTTYQFLYADIITPNAGLGILTGTLTPFTQFAFEKPTEFRYNPRSLVSQSI